jgi:ribosomal subunit interface protein
MERPNPLRTHHDWTGGAMEIVVRGRHLDVSERFREYATARLSRLEQHGAPIQRIDVEVTYEANPRQADQAIRVELTCASKGPVVRAEYAAADKYVAFDVASDRLMERLRKGADRRRELARARARGNEAAARAGITVEPVAPPEQAGADDVEAADGIVFAAGPLVVREKTHDSRPMTVEQALDAMELVGHDFYLFHDVRTDKPSVVYRRRGYDYGLIRLDVSGAAVDVVPEAELADQPGR